MLKISDREVIEKIKKGEIDQYFHIVKKYSPAVIRFIRLKVADREDAEDIAQNVFFNFYKAIGRFDTQRPVSAYLFQIARNEIKMYFRSRKKTVSLNERIAADESDIFFLDNLEILLKNLPKSQKQVLKLFSEGYTYAEIAKKVGRPLNTVRTLIRRARLAVVGEKNEKTGE